MNNFADATSITYETVWGGSCDHHLCTEGCVSFFNVNFTDGGSVGGYVCRTHLNQYEAAWGLPVSTEMQVAA